MSRQAKYVVAFAAGALALLVCLCWFSAHRQTHGLSTSLGWGHGKLETSERAYYTNRINTIISAWQEMAKQARRSRTGEVEDSHFTCLVVDTGKKEIRMERDGRILPLYHTDLPLRAAREHRTPCGESVSHSWSPLQATHAGTFLSRRHTRQPGARELLLQQFQYRK